MQFCQIFLLCLLLGVSAADLSEQWNTFKRDHNKQYSSPIEESERKEIFLKNVDRMNAYVSSHPNANFTMKINSLFDRRAEELALKPKVLSAARNSLPSESVVDTRDLPASLDWRSKGAITPVRNQGLSGEIVAGIVSTELVESLQAIRTGALVEGSFNRVFDCCPQPIDQFQCIKKMGGICRQTDYPTALGKCEPNQCTPFTNIGTIKVLPPGLESYMLTWIQNSTLWAELDATAINFMAYTGGVYDDDTTCSRTDVDHVVQIVGYGVEQGTPYWLCKNSWGANWGDQGYIRIARWKNMCGIANNVVLVADSIVSHAARLSILYGSFLALFLTRYLL